MILARPRSPNWVRNSPEIAHSRSNFDSQTKSLGTSKQLEKTVGSKEVINLGRCIFITDPYLGCCDSDTGGRTAQALPKETHVHWAKLDVNELQ